LSLSRWEILLRLLECVRDQGQAPPRDADRSGWGREQAESWFEPANVV